MSGVFSLNTSGALLGYSGVQGNVTAEDGKPLSGVFVMASQGGVVKAQAFTGVAGSYEISGLPAGSYELRTHLANYSTGLRVIDLSFGQTRTEHFTLHIKPAEPPVQPGSRDHRDPDRMMGQLKFFNGAEFTAIRVFDASKPTVIMTHGWLSNPEVWARGMASNMTWVGASANILAWDWEQDADTGLLLSKALSAVCRQGEGLGRALEDLFLQVGFSRGVHFVGHSLGCLLNAEAANYLHERSSLEWLRSKTHMTLLDNAVLANIEGTFVQLVWASGPFPAPYEAGGVLTDGWVSPTPKHSTWMDNYISLVGLPVGRSLNVLLPRAPEFADTSNPKTLLASVHGYAASWYSATAASPDSSIIGNYWSYEQRGDSAAFAPLGVSFIQDMSSSDPFAVVPITPFQFKAATYRYSTTFTTMGLASVVNGTVGVVKQAGQVGVEIVESFLNPGTPVFSRTANTTPMYYSQPEVTQVPAWTLSFNLANQPLTVLPAATEGAANAESPKEPPRVWMSLAVPKRAAAFSFDFQFSGQPEQDYLSLEVAGTNVFALETRFMPTNSLLNSGIIPVYDWAGTTAEFFFGLLGGTSTNSNLAISGLRFYQIDSPSLACEVQGGFLLVSWPAAAGNYQLQSTTNIDDVSAWLDVTATQGLLGTRSVVTNVADGVARFYRLRSASN